MAVISPLEIGNNSKYNFINDEFYILLSYHQKDTLAQEQPLSITPSLNSVLNAKKNGVSSLKLMMDENSSYSSLEESLSSSSSSSCSSLSVSMASSFIQQRHDPDCSISFPVDLNDHPLSNSDDDEDDEQIEFCYCGGDDDSHKINDKEITTKTSSLFKLAQLKISKSFKKLSDLAMSISQSTLRTQQQLLTISTLRFDARMTDDKLPLLVSETELEMFERATDEEESKEEEEIMNRHRESRINSRFLRIYAHDYSSKLKGQLPFTDDQLDYQLNNYATLQNCEKEMVKLSLLAREKLWSNVVLTPREDQITSIDKDTTRIFINQNVCQSWNVQQDELKPFGVIKVANKQRYQYIRKGWTDSRWISSCN